MNREQELCAECLCFPGPQVSEVTDPAKRAAGDERLFKPVNCSACRGPRSSRNKKENHSFRKDSEAAGRSGQKRSKISTTTATCSQWERRTGAGGWGRTTCLDPAVAPNAPYPRDRADLSTDYDQHLLSSPTGPCGPTPTGTHMWGLQAHAWEPQLFRLFANREEGKGVWV